MMSAFNEVRKYQPESCDVSSEDLNEIDIDVKISEKDTSYSQNMCSAETASGSSVKGEFI